MFSQLRWFSEQLLGNQVLKHLVKVQQKLGLFLFQQLVVTDLTLG